jgi:hypothetical protein
MTCDLVAFYLGGAVNPAVDEFGFYTLTSPFGTVAQMLVASFGIRVGASNGLQSAPMVLYREHESVYAGSVVRPLGRRPIGGANPDVFGPSVGLDCSFGA